MDLLRILLVIWAISSSVAKGASIIKVGASVSGYPDGKQIIKEDLLWDMKDTESSSAQKPSKNTSTTTANC